MLRREGVISEQNFKNPRWGFNIFFARVGSGVLAAATVSKGTLAHKKRVANPMSRKNQVANQICLESTPTVSAKTPKWSSKKPNNDVSFIPLPRGRAGGDGGAAAGHGDVAELLPQQTPPPPPRSRQCARSLRMARLLHTPTFTCPIWHQLFIGRVLVIGWCWTVLQFFLCLLRNDLFFSCHQISSPPFILFFFFRFIARFIIKPGAQNSVRDKDCRQLYFLVFPSYHLGTPLPLRCDVLPGRRYHCVCDKLCPRWSIPSLWALPSPLRCDVSRAVHVGPRGLHRPQGSGPPQWSPRALFFQHHFIYLSSHFQDTAV